MYIFPLWEEIQKPDVGSEMLYLQQTLKYTQRLCFMVTREDHLACLVFTLLQRNSIYF